MIKFEKVHPGAVLLSVVRNRAGHTTTYRDDVYFVRVVDIDHAAGKATISWNGNKPELAFRRRIEKLYTKLPKRVRDAMGDNAEYYHSRVSLGTPKTDEAT